MNGDTLSGLDLGATIRGFAAGQIVFDRYRLDRILGRGGMGVVWLAHDQELGEDIALKFLPEAVRLDALALEELKRETRKSRKLTHRNIVRVYNFVSDAHCAGISMEWIDGSTLSTLRMARPNRVFEPEELKPWVRQVCEALEYAHGVAKLIHRDLKPANIMLTAGGEAKMTDFGISCSLTESASRVSLQNTSSGTLAYMSPQQALGARPTVSDDIYALGATLYELIAGKPPFFRGDLYMQIRDVVPVLMAERRAESEIPADGIPGEWEVAVAACLEKDPAKRPQSAMEVAWRLRLVDDFERKGTVEIPRPEMIRVPQELERTLPEGSATPSTPTTGALTSLVVTRPERIEGLGKKLTTSAGKLLTAFKTRRSEPRTAPPPEVTVGPPRHGGPPPLPPPLPLPAAPPGPPPWIPAPGPSREFPGMALVREHPVQAGAAAISLVFMFAVMIGLFSRPHPGPIAQKPTPAPAATPVPTVTPAPTVAPTPIPAPTFAPTPVPAASAVVQAETPSPIPVQPLPAPSALPASSSAPATQAAPIIDRELVGRWETGSGHSRTHWELKADGQYILTVAGLVTDSGTMSSTNGQIQQFSKKSPQPSSVTYQLNNGDLETQGLGPFDGAEWHRITGSTSHSTSRRSEGSTHSGEGIGQKFKHGFSAIRHFF